MVQMKARPQVYCVKREGRVAHPLISANVDSRALRLPGDARSQGHSHGCRQGAIAVFMGSHLHDNYKSTYQMLPLCLELSKALSSVLTLSVLTISL